MIWSDKKIEEALAKGYINIEPFDKSMLQPNSIDLRLDDEILVYNSDSNNFESAFLSDDDFELQRGEFVLASTLEKITLGNSMCGQVDGKSSYGRKGVQVHQTAGWIDSCFSGNITLEMCTIGQPIKLEVGMPICQLVLFDAYPSEKPYGSEGLNSHYQNQTKVTKSWIQ